jgi:uncharacterized protein (TIGR03067 family)
MRSVVFAVTVGGFLVILGAPGTAGEKASKKDEDLIKGTWSIKSAAKEGQKESEDKLKELKITFAAGGKLNVMGPGKDSEGTYKLDASRKPKQIDVTIDDGGKELTLKGIYELKKDSLKICLAHPPDERPTEFATQAGVKTMLIVFRREKK